MKTNKLSHNRSILGPMAPILIAALVLLGACSKTQDFESLKANAMAQVGAGEYNKAREDLQKALKLKRVPSIEEKIKSVEGK